MDSGHGEAPGAVSSMLAPNDGLAPHHCHQQNGLRALSPQTGKWHPGSYSAVKTWQDCRNEGRLSSSAILCHFYTISGPPAYGGLAAT